MSVDPQKTHQAGLSPEAAQAGGRLGPEGEARSRRLVEQAGETGGAPPQGTISAERLREVLDRLTTGFYDRPEVRDQVARAVTRDLDTRPTD